MVFKLWRGVILIHQFYTFKSYLARSYVKWNSFSDMWEIKQEIKHASFPRKSPLGKDGEHQNVTHCEYKLVYKVNAVIQNYPEVN